MKLAPLEMVDASSWKRRTDDNKLSNMEDHPRYKDIEILDKDAEILGGFFIEYNTKESINIFWDTKDNLKKYVK